MSGERFEVEIPAFVLDDGRQSRADRPLMWLPPPGKREVVLTSADGKELDRVRFEVRGLRRAHAQ